MKNYIRLIIISLLFSFLSGCLEDPEYSIVSVITNDEVEYIEGGVILKGEIETENFLRTSIETLGFCYSLEKEPTVSDSTIVLEKPMWGEYSAILSDLKEGTKYFVRAFAQNKYGVVYGEEIYFTSLTRPKVSTIDVSENDNHVLLVKCELISVGSDEVDLLGVCYSINNSEPTLEKDSLQEVTTIKKGVYEITYPINANTKYYVRAVAQNLAGVAYGPVKEIVTKKQTYTITFNSNDGTTQSNSMKVNSMETNMLPANTFDREGYTFIGWNTKTDGSGVSYTDKQIITTDNNLILYAQWDKKSHKIIFKSNGGSGSMLNADVKYDDSYTLPSCYFTRSGYTFIGWNTNADGSGISYSDHQIITIKGDLILYALWSVSTYVVTLYSNDGYESVERIEVKHYDSYLLPSDLFTRKGYKFVSWNTSSSGNGTSYIAKQKIIVTKNLSLYAQWEKNKYTITFDSNGGTGSMQSIIFKYLEDNTLPTNTFTRTGYSFVGWNTNADGSGVFYSDRQNITTSDNLTLYAQWKKNTYTITFNSNGGSGSMQKLELQYLANITLPSNKFTRKGYTFKGWKSDDGKFYSVNEIITINKNTTLYAQWEKNKYIITFNSNGASGNMTSVEVEYGQSYTLPSNTFTLLGYTFLWWNTKEDATGTTYDDKQTITIYDNIVLYAQWKINMESGHSYVDLGLPSGTLWATCNVGAESPEDYGDYFAWGETETKENYDWESYKWCEGTIDTQIKYCTNSAYGIVDNKTILELADDVAHVNWGGNWRIPTEEEQNELRTKCTWVWGENNGVNGYIVKGNNGNSIFLPAAGIRFMYSSLYTNTEGQYWNTSISTSNGSSYLKFNSNSIFLSPSYRCYGFSVRPVISNNSIGPDTPVHPIKYKVSFDANDGSGESSSIDVSRTEKVILLNKFVRDGYVFLNWNTKADGSGLSYENAEEIMVAGDLILYAQWRKYDTPKVTTSNVTDITNNSASCSGSIISLDYEIIERGICYSLSSTPTISSYVIKSGAGVGAFTCSLTALSSGTTYYVRAYAKYSGGEIYGDVKSFRTSYPAPIVTTSSTVSNKTDVSAVCSGSVSSPHYTISERGICYATHSNPTTSSNIIRYATSLTGTFSANLTDLYQATTYYYRAYVIYGGNTVYGAVMSFTTCSSPQVTTSNVSNITFSSAYCAGTVTTTDITITERGICYSTYSNPTISSLKVISGSGTGSYSCYLSGLSQGVTYYARAYAKYSGGVVYGDVKTFRTKTVPQVSDVYLLKKSESSIKCEVDVFSPDFSIIERGICYGKYPSPTTDDNVSNSSASTGKHIYNIDGFSEGITYYLRGYVKYEGGIIYGKELQFTFTTSSKLYFIDSRDWDSVGIMYTYIWNSANDDPNVNDDAGIYKWPGVKANKESITYNGYSIYSFDISGFNADYIIFNSYDVSYGNYRYKTKDLKIDLSRPYYYEGSWYGSLSEIP